MRHEVVAAPRWYSTHDASRGQTRRYTYDARRVPRARFPKSLTSDYNHVSVTSTRDGLMDAAIDLIAEHGFREATVGDIEERAGLTRGGRAFYRHFSAKEEVVVAAFERHLDGVKQFESLESLLPLGDLRSELTLICRGGLIQLTAERKLVRVLEKEGDRFPQIRHRLRESMVNAGHRQLVGVIGRYTDAIDTQALAVTLLGGIVNYRRNDWTFDGPALDVDGERFIAAWVAAAVAAITSDHHQENQRTR